MKKMLKKIPKFKSEKAEREFWQSNYSVSPDVILAEARIYNMMDSRSGRE